MSPNHIESSVSFTDAERNRGAPSAETLAKALELVQKHGFVRLLNVFSQSEIASFKQHYERRYRLYLEGTYKPDQRPLFTVDVEGPFGEPTFFANPLTYSILKKRLGKDCILGAMSSVASFPGAPDQYIHRDSQAIFGEHEHDYEIDKGLPSYAMTVLIPLVDCNKETGCTKIWPGSHLRNDKEKTEKTAPLEPEVPAGSVLLTDSKVVHCGGANHSDKVRPLIYMSYHRSWFRDFWGYESRPPVNVSRRQLKKVPNEYQHMLTWTKDPYPLIKLRNAAKRHLPFHLVKKVRSSLRRNSDAAY